jgi:transcriptional regulator with XRE-family HTH domain
MDFRGASKMPITIASAMPAKKPPKTSFGERLFAFRKARGLTQVQLAEALNSTQRVISYYETEAELPPSGVIVTLARVLNVSTDELLGVKPAKPAQGGTQNRRLWKRFQRMESLPERDQRAVLRLINSLVASNNGDRSSSSAHQ